MIEPARVITGSDDKRSNGTHDSTKSEQGRREVHHDDFGAHATVAELVDGVGAARNQENDGNNRDGEKSQRGKEGGTNKGHLVQLALLHGIQGKKVVDQSADEHDESETNGGIDGAEEDLPWHGPSKLGVICAQEPLCEDEVHDEEENNTSVGEDAGSDTDVDVGRTESPYYAHNVGADTGHAQTEADTGNNKLVIAAVVDLEDGHMQSSGENKEEEGDGGERNIEGLGGQTAKTSRV